MASDMHLISCRTCGSGQYLSASACVSWLDSQLCKSLHTLLRLVVICSAALPHCACSCQQLAVVFSASHMSSPRLCSSG
jgi:hypothetical protein